MSRHAPRIAATGFVSSLMACLLVCLILAPAALAQQSQGSVSVVVVDPSGGVIPGAQLKLVDLSTNDARQATTQEAGNYTFVNLSFGQYKLTVTKEGFETQTYNVVVQSARNTDVRAALKVGSTQQVVEVVGGAAPLVETSSSATNITIDTKQIEDLPLGGRSVSQLSYLAAGYNGTWNGLPGIAQGNTIDGILGNTSRWRYGSSNQATSTGVTPRLENIAEMTVSTDQLDLNQGWGNSNMQITYVTRRGTNNWHGRLYEDHRNSALNATNFYQNGKAKYHLNEFGGSVGGPIFKDKLFFFASYSMQKQPGGSTATANYPTANAQIGKFQYADGTTVNLFDVAKAYNLANGTHVPEGVNSTVSSWLNQINGWRTSSGSQYAGAPPSDPNLSTWFWMYNNPVTYYYPTFRVDYNVSQNLRFNVAYNQTKYNRPNAYSDHWPGDGRGAGDKSNAATASFGLEWTITPTLINQFKGGYLYTANWYGVGGVEGYYKTPEIQYNYGNIDDYYEKPNSRMQPVISLSDNMTWVKGAHTFSFGFNAYRDQNKYWDPKEGFTLMGMWLSEGDPALEAMSASSIAAIAGKTPTDEDLGRAQQLFATLTGTVGGYWGRHPYDPKTGTYYTGVGMNSLNELLRSWGMFAQDSYKLKNNLTLNYGLRWDFVSPDKDLTGKYHSMTPTDIFGPTGVWDLFNPGSLKGTNDPLQTAREAAYNSWNVTPQPAIGIAWTPRSNGNFVEKLLGGDKTVVRAGYSFRRFTEPQQFVWDMGSIYAVGFYQTFWADPTTSGSGPGTFYPGSKFVNDKFPDYIYQPLALDKVLHLKDTTFGSASAAALDPNIRQPYTQSWNLGIQRELGPSRAIEIRYNGNRTIRQWIAQNVNETNIFENGFLSEFKNAQGNLAIFKQANPTCDQANQVRCSFANNGLPGQVNLPIMTAAGISFTNSGFKTNLVNGQAGSFANGIAFNRDYFCNMVGSTFSPCGADAGPGAGYPINFWIANPYAIGAWMGAPYMTDRGFSNYNGLQVEFRQRQWRGMTMTANYTWSRTMGVATAGDWMGGYQQYTIRDIMSSYGPTGTDRNHVVHVNATYDLPFGKGKSFLNQGGIVDKVLGGWTVSTIITFQSGSPFRITGQNQTFNDQRDGGVILNGLTPQDIEAHQGHFWVNNSDGTRTPYFLDPAWVKQVRNVNILSNTTPGTWGQIVWLHGPHQTYTDIGISKSAAITERWKFKFQTEMLNAFNHPTFGQSSTGISSSSFGRGSQTATSRRIEFRANLEF